DGADEDECVVGGPDALSAGIAASSTATCSCGPTTAAVKRPKKSSAIFRATPSIKRAPTCARRPPTCACERYTRRVPALSVSRSTCAPPLPKPAAPPDPSKVIEYDCGGCKSVSTILP